MLFKSKFYQGFCRSCDISKVLLISAIKLVINLDCFRAEASDITQIIWVGWDNLRPLQDNLSRLRPVQDLSNTYVHFLCMWSTQASFPGYLSTVFLIVQLWLRRIITIIRFYIIGILVSSWLINLVMIIVPMPSPPSSCSSSITMFIIITIPMMTNLIVE